MQREEVGWERWGKDQDCDLQCKETSGWEQAVGHEVWRNKMSKEAAENSSDVLVYDIQWNNTPLQGSNKLPSEMVSLTMCVCCSNTTIQSFDGLHLYVNADVHFNNLFHYINLQSCWPGRVNVLVDATRSVEIGYSYLSYMFVKEIQILDTNTNFFCYFMLFIVISIVNYMCK